MTDPRPTLGLALDQVGRIIDAVRPEQLDLPTPCDEYAVRDLLGHLLSVVRRIDHALQGGNALDIPVITTGTDDWSADWKTYRAAADATLADDTLLTRVCRLPWGTVPGAGAVAAYSGELTTHSWDLATAISREDLLDPALAEAVLPTVQQFIPADPRGGPIPFGAVVPVPADATPYVRLAGWMGRRV
ncbi:hypothetical protein Kfla_2223 [Kribbella flavida DSM 17836]|uniref:Mycothiol-dependent maleylpyruvate isomerase metal-binding domain-containing protein n=1 Tax=Kribbella flavida (strain DSM 17836 / JCM 10339 / NBRC 14399) TaxID=479435 RepID=D2PTI6_KRIFD|nr:TIGR03086 family metal-binding protein [Kribbella flavida]ADB31299.1 hypothetical protein Kfla_2223 [Kribbella flavida DSM 17836]